LQLRKLINTPTEDVYYSAQRQMHMLNDQSPTNGTNKHRRTIRKRRHTRPRPRHDADESKDEPPSTRNSSNRRHRCPHQAPWSEMHVGRPRASPRLSAARKQPHINSASPQRHLSVTSAAHHISTQHPPLFGGGALVATSVVGTTSSAPCRLMYSG